MKKSGFKTIQELSDSIAATLPDSERDQYLNLMKALQDTDVFLGNASSVLTCVLGIAGGLRFFTGNGECPALYYLSQLQLTRIAQRGWLSRCVGREFSEQNSLGASNCSLQVTPPLPVPTSTIY